MLPTNLSASASSFRICIASCGIRFSISAYFSFVIPAFFQGLAAAYCFRVMPRMAQGFSGVDSGMWITKRDFQALTGNVKNTDVPLPGSLSTQIFPPCCSMNCLHRNNPRPVPPSPRVPGREAFLSSEKMRFLVG